MAEGDEGGSAVSEHGGHGAVDPAKDKKKREQVLVVTAIIGVLLTVVLIIRRNAAGSSSGATDPNAAYNAGVAAGSGVSGSDGGGGFAPPPDLSGITAAEAQNQSLLAGLATTLSGLPATLAAAMPNQSTQNSAGGNNPAPVSINFTSAAAPAAATPESAPASDPVASQPPQPSWASTTFNGGGSTYFGVPNEGALAIAQSQGYKITTAKAAGVPGGTTKAKYAYK